MKKYITPKISLLRNLTSPSFIHDHIINTEHFPSNAIEELNTEYQNSFIAFLSYKMLIPGKIKRLEKSRQCSHESEFQMFTKKQDSNRLKIS